MFLSAAAFTLAAASISMKVQDTSAPASLDCSQQQLFEGCLRQPLALSSLQ